MGSRTTIVAGLLSGAAVAITVLVAAVALIPDPAVETGGSATAPSGAAAASASPASSGSSVGGVGGSVEPTVSPSIVEPAVRIGQPAPELRLPQLAGGEIDLASLAGRPVWISFVRTTCSPCLDELPLLNGFAARYADSGLVVIAIAASDDEGAVAALALRLNLTIPVGLDTVGVAEAAWGAEVLPTDVWVDRDGIVRTVAVGGTGPDVMAENLSTILPGVDVTP